MQTRDFDPTGRIVVTVTGTSGLPVAGAEVALTGDDVGGAQAPVAVDVLFLLDATGSMGDQIIG